MTNAELNLAIAKLVYPDAIHYRKDSVGDLYAFYGNGVMLKCPDCNNWNDLMPLVVEHKICLCPEYFSDTGYTGKWDAEFDDCGFAVISNDDDPQRALAECLLKVLEAKDE